MNNKIATRGNTSDICCDQIATDKTSTVNGQPDLNFHDFFRENWEAEQ